MNTQLFISRVAVPIIEAWDFPAMLIEGGEPFVINDSMYKLLSWSDTRDSRFSIEQTQEGDRILGLVHGYQGVPRAVSLKCAQFAIPDSKWLVVVCDNSPLPLLRLLLAAMAAHVKHFQAGKSELELELPDICWESKMPDNGDMLGYDARVLSQWHTFRDIYTLSEQGWQRVCKTPLRDTNMRVAGVVTVYESLSGGEPEIVRIIGDRHILENIVDNSSSVLFSCANDEDYPIEYISKNIASYGISEDVALGRGILADLFAPRERGGLFAEINKNRGSLSDFSYEHSLTLSDGEKRQMRTVMRFAANQTGQITSLEGQMTDITEHCAAMASLNEIKRPLEETLGYDLMENISPIGNEVSLYDVVDITETQELFAKMFSVSSVIVDLVGTPITQSISYSPAGEVCSFVNLAGGQEVCRECYGHIAKMTAASGHNEVFQCKATGLMMTAAPIKIGERIVAAWVLCQMLTDGSGGRFKPRSVKLNGLNAEPLQKMLNDIPRFSIAKFESVRSMLDLVAEQVSALATRSAQFFVQRDVAEQERGHKSRLSDNEALLFDCFSRLELSGLGSPLELLEMIARKLRFSRAYYYQLETNYVLRYEWSDKTRLPRALRMPPYNIFPEYSRQSLEIYDASKIMETPLRRYAEMSGARCVIHMPLFNGGQLTGILGLDECSFGRIFFDADRKLLSSLLGTVAAMLKKNESESGAIAVEQCLNEVRTCLQFM